MKPCGFLTSFSLEAPQDVDAIADAIHKVLSGIEELRGLDHKAIRNQRLGSRRPRELAAKRCAAAKLSMKIAPRVGFAVVGLGAIAQSSVLPCFARSKRAVLAGLVGRDKERGRPPGSKIQGPLLSTAPTSTPRAWRILRSPPCMSLLLRANIRN